MLFTTIVAAMLSTAIGYAQKIETAIIDGQVYPVINCIQGLSSTNYTTTSKGNKQEELKTVAADAKVYARFAVAKSDNSTSTTWANAFTVCSSVSGGGWRPPTQRELVLIWVLKRELEQTSGFTPFGVGDNSHYWSASEAHTDYGRNVSFKTGNTNNHTKPSNYSVRCIKEL